MVAHMPLINIALPGSCYFIFDLLILMVTFDYLPVADILPLGYSPTDFWNERFDWLGYNSVNFVENMGSLILYLGFIIF